MLDAKIASALNKIIQSSHFKKKVSLEEQKFQKEDRFLRGRQIAFMIYDNIRVAGAHDIVLDYADLFSVAFRADHVQEFDSRWDEVPISMSKIPSDDVLETLYKQSKDTIPMPTFARRPSTVSSLIPVEFPHNSMVGPQRQQISELQVDKFPSPQSFFVWKIRFDNQVTTCSDFPTSSRSVCGENVPKLRDVGRETSPSHLPRTSSSQDFVFDITDTPKIPQPKEEVE